MSSLRAQALVRPLVRKLHPYVPGEQPRIKGLVKLNTNENPYPPAPKVLQAIQKATDQRLRLYPNPTAQALREKLAKFHNCSPQNIFVGNGSDEVLALAVRAFVEPMAALPKQRFSRGTLQYFSPSYSLYPVLAATHGARSNPVPLTPDFGIPSIPVLRRERRWDFNAALTFITTPNAPTGRGYSLAELEPICLSQRRVVLLDEAYVDFAQEHAMELALKYPHVLVARTFSKAYSLCFLRVGYCVGHPELILALDKLRDSYNVNGLAQVAAIAALDNLPYYRENFQKIIRTRNRLGEKLAELGFQVLPSQTNFLLAKPPKFPARKWLELLREKKVLVRWFSYPEVKDYLRITIGTDREANAFLKAAGQILGRRK